MTNPQMPAGAPDYAEIAGVLWRLTEQIDSGAVTATPAMKYRLEGAAMALAALGEGRALTVDELLSTLGIA